MSRLWTFVSCLQKRDTKQDIPQSSSLTSDRLNTETLGISHHLLTNKCQWGVYSLLEKLP
jgi:hypothetical protein